MTLRWLALTCALFCAQAVQAELRCGVDPATDAHHCFEAKSLKEKDGIRFAPLLRGGPKTVRPTSYTLHANCRTQVLHVKDADGVSFGGGLFSATEMSRQLGHEMCAYPLWTAPASKKK